MMDNINTESGKSEAEAEEYEDGVLTGGEYKQSLLKYEDMEKENRVYEPHQPECDNNKTCELEHTSGEWGYEPQVLNHNNSALGTHGNRHRCDNSNNMCGFTPQCEPHTPSNTTPHALHPTSTTPNPSITWLCPLPWPNPNTHHPYNKPQNHNAHALTTPLPITPIHREIPTWTSIT